MEGTLRENEIFDFIDHRIWVEIYSLLSCRDFGSLFLTCKTLCDVACHFVTKLPFLNPNRKFDHSGFIFQQQGRFSKNAFAHFHALTSLNLVICSTEHIQSEHIQKTIGSKKLQELKLTIHRNNKKLPSVALCDVDWVGGEIISQSGSNLTSLSINCISLFPHRREFKTFSLIEDSICKLTKLEHLELYLCNYKLISASNEKGSCRFVPAPTQLKKLSLYSQADYLPVKLPDLPSLHTLEVESSIRLLMPWPNIKHLYVIMATAMEQSPPIFSAYYSAVSHNLPIVLESLSLDGHLMISSSFQFDHLMPNREDQWQNTVIHKLIMKNVDLVIGTSFSFFMQLHKVADLEFENVTPILTKQFDASKCNPKVVAQLTTFLVNHVQCLMME